MRKSKLLYAVSLMLLAALLALGVPALAQEQAQVGDEPAPETSAAPLFLQNFTATDIDGNEVDETLFAPYELTMINIWATYCQPCLMEMPDLGKLSTDMAERNVQIVGLVSDVLNADGSISQSQVDFAKEIVESTGASYLHLMPSQDLINILLWQVSGVPTTLFVNSAGDLVGYVYMGSASYDQWAQRIEETLEAL